MRDRYVRLVLAFVAWMLVPAVANASTLEREDAARVVSADAMPAVDGAQSRTDDRVVPTDGAACSWGVTYTPAPSVVAVVDVAAPRDIPVVPVRLSAARPRAPPIA